METVIALLIVGLFSLWVFSLKQEIVEMQKNTAHPAVKSAPAPVHAPASAPAHNPARISTDGVPTWTIG